MNRHTQRLPNYLEHILQAIQRIRRFTKDMDESAFLRNELVQDAVIRNIEILGEAARNIARDHQNFAEQHSEVQWENIYLMRNRVVHGYFTVDLEIVWKTLQEDLPTLERQVSNLLKTLPPSS